VPKKRIAILSPTNRNPGKPHGGITPVVTNLANAFVERGHPVDMVLFVPRASLERPRGLDDRIDVINLGKGPKAVGSLRLWRYLRTGKPSILLSAGWRANLMAAWSSRLPGVETRVWGGVHNSLSLGQEGMNPILRWRKNLGIRHACKAFEGLVAVSRGVAEDLIRTAGVPGEKVHVISNPILKPELLERAREKAAHPWFGSAHPPIILGVGRLARQKDFPTLIRAFARVLESHPCRLVILGEGQERPALEKLIDEMGLGDVIELPGFVENPFAYMSRAALLVLSSAWEGFGNVLAEALALGLPVVSTDCPSGPREILEDGRFGALVPVGDVEAMAEAMTHTLDHPPDKENLLRASLRFQVDECAEKYLKTFGIRD
jgi:glycosyltransferase involved in cell wall biosynthesis